jgi:hypothetical protein
MKDTLNVISHEPSSEVEVAPANLAALQRALARLYTDAAFRDRFQQNPVAAGAEIGLDPETTRAMAGPNFKGVGAFARSLKLKRLGESSAYLPLTRKFLGDDFSRLFLRYAESPLPPATNRPLADALRFANFLASEVAQGGLGPSWIGDLARYEAAWLSARFGARRLVIRRFRFRMDEFGAGDSSLDRFEIKAEEKSFVGVWWRSWTKGDVRHFVLVVPRMPRSRIAKTVVAPIRGA